MESVEPHRQSEAELKSRIVARSQAVTFVQAHSETIPRHLPLWPRRVITSVLNSGYNALPYETENRSGPGQCPWVSRGYRHVRGEGRIPEW
jgi:hypothetical protein